MLHIINLEEIQNILLKIPNLVDLQEKKDPNFTGNVKQWLSAIEKVLTNNRMPEAGNIASLRSELISAERGIIPENLQIQGRASRRKISDATASRLIKKADEIISSAICKDQERVAEAERIAQQLVTISKAKGLIKEIPRGDHFTEKIKTVWNHISADPDLSPGTINLTGLLGINDALIILDRIIVRNNKLNITQKF